MKNINSKQTSFSKVYGDTSHSSIMQKIQNEIRDFIITKQWKIITTLNSSLKELQCELEFVKNNLVHTLKNIVNLKKQQQTSHNKTNSRNYNNLFSPPKYNNLTSSFISSGNAIKNRTHRKINSLVTKAPKLNISGYCPSDAQTNTSIYNSNNNNNKITEYVNTLYKRTNHQDLLNFSQNSILISTFNNENGNSDGKNNKKYIPNNNCDNNQNKTQMYISVNSNKKPSKQDVAKGIKKKASLTKLSYGNSNTRNYYHRPNSSIGKNCETENLCGNNKGINYNINNTTVSNFLNNNYCTPRADTKKIKMFGSQTKQKQQSGGCSKAEKIRKIGKI